MLNRVYTTFKEDVLNILSRRKKEQRCVGAALCPDGMALAVLSRSSEDGVSPVLEHAAQVCCSTDACGTTLKQMVAGLNLGNAPCVGVLPRGSYNLIQTELPAVPADELHEAVRWQIRDLLDFPPDEAVIETIAFEDTANGQPLSFAVAAKRERIENLVQIVRDEGGLDLRAIDIPELSLRALLHQVEGSDQGIALLILWPTEGMVVITRGEDLCMARKVGIGLEALVNAADPEAEAGVEISMAQQELLDEAILDIQRSLDFYESNVARRPVRKVLIAPLDYPLQGLVEYLDTYLNPEVSFLDLKQILDQAYPRVENSDHGVELINPCVLPAIGAALRAFEMLP
jgi:MSHA biogenesis protein MshI